VSSLFLLYQDAEDRAVAVQVQQALTPAVRLELFPKSTIDIFLSIIETDGFESCVAAAIIAASTALADGGIEMLGLVAACAAVSSFACWSLYILIVGRSLSLTKNVGSTLRKRRSS
jgi:hypothetical protein